MPRFPRPRLGRGRRRSAPAPGPETPTGEHPLTGQGLDGVRAWIAQLDRQVRTRTAIGAALGLLALAAGGAGILLALDAKDEAATTADLNEVRTKITEVEQSVLRTASQDLAGFRMRLDDLTGLIRSRRTADKRSRAELRAARNEIDDLRSQISDLRGRLADLETEVATKADEEPQGSR